MAVLKKVFPKTAAGRKSVDRAAGNRSCGAVGAGIESRFDAAASVFPRPRPIHPQGIADVIAVPEPGDSPELVRARRSWR
jgi:hypothetical protein